MRVFNADGELLVLDANAAVDDTAYDESTWNGVTDKAASKNALRDKVEALIEDTAYGAGWNGVTDVAPSKNAVYDKIEAIGGVVFTDYKYYVDLAASASYTPAAQSLATLFNEKGTLDTAGIYIQLYDGAGWVNAHAALVHESSCPLNQDNAQSLRITAGATGYKIMVTGVVWS